MVEEIRVGVTGVGGGVGQAILRSLSLSALPVCSVGFDMNPDSAGFFFCDRAYVVPPASNPSYIGRLLDLCDREKIDVLIPGSDPELLPLTLARDRIGEAGIQVLVAAPEAIRLVRNKRETARFLTERDLPFAETALVNEATELLARVGFPLVAKPIDGSATRNVHILFSSDELEEYVGREGLIVQEYLAPAAWGIPRPMLRPEDVYSDGILRQEEEISIQFVFSQNARELGSFTSRNRLMNGVPMLIEPESHLEALDAARRICHELLTLGMTGPCNLQGKLTEDGIVFYEINLRFTGITAMRTEMGFREVEAAIRDAFSGEPEDSVGRLLVQPDDLVCLRYVTEQVTSRTLLEQLRREGRSGLGEER